MKKLFILLALVFLASCTTDTGTIFSTDDFKDLGNANFSKKVKFDEYAYNNFYNLDKDFNLAKLVQSDYLFAILDDELNLVKKIIKKEPDLDIPNSLNILEASLKDNQLVLTINDYTQSKIVAIKYNLKNEQLSIKEEIDYEKLGNAFYIYPTSDGNYIANCTNMDSEMDYARKYNKDFEPIKTLPLSFTPTNDDLEYLWYNFNMSFTNRILKLPKNQYLITVSKIKELVLVDEDLNVLHKIDTPFNKNQIEEIIQKPNKSFYFSLPLITPKYIIIPYYDRNPETNEIKNTKLLFYNHELKPLKSINIGSNRVIISLSKDESLLYALNYEDEEVYIYGTEKLFEKN